MSKSIFGLGVITAFILGVASVSGQQLVTVEQARVVLERAMHGWVTERVNSAVEKMKNKSISQALAADAPHALVGDAAP